MKKTLFICASVFCIILTSCATKNSENNDAKSAACEQWNYVVKIIESESPNSIRDYTEAANTSWPYFVELSDFDYKYHQQLQTIELIKSAGEGLISNGKATDIQDSVQEIKDFCKN